MRLRYLATFILLFIPASALAWGPSGHSIIAEVAQRHLSASSLAEIKRLFGGEVSLASKASWADDYKFTEAGKHTKIWHYVDIDVSKSSYDPTDCHDGNVQECLVKAIPAEIDILKDKSKSDDDRRLALLLLIHLIGDLEQPLHTTSVGNDGGGNSTFVSLEAKRPDGTTLKRSSKFHAMWDETLIDLHSYAWGSYADEIDSSPLPTVTATVFDENTIAGWANETHCDGIEGYRLLTPQIPKGSGTCPTLQNFVLPDTSQHPIMLNDAYAVPATAILTKELAIGASRLKTVLDFALQP